MSQINVIGYSNFNVKDQSNPDISEKRGFYVAGSVETKLYSEKTRRQPNKEIIEFGSHQKEVRMVASVTMNKNYILGCSSPITKDFKSRETLIICGDNEKMEEKNNKLEEKAKEASQVNEITPWQFIKRMGLLFYASFYVPIKYGFVDAEINYDTGKIKPLYHKK
jgi:hypothetical protein